MTEYNTLNVKLSNSRLSKLKLGIKNCTEVNLNLPSNVVCNTNDKTNDYLRCCSPKDSPFSQVL